MLKAIIFDYNGILVDDLVYHRDAYLRVAEELGFSLAPDAIWQYISATPDEKRVLFGEITDESISELKEQIEKNMEVLFKHFENSNLYQVANEMFIDLVIGTGAMVVQKGTLEKPLKFSAIPVNTLILMDDPTQPVQNVGRELYIPHRDIKTIWPDAELSQSLQDAVKSKPDAMITLKEEKKAIF